MVLDSGSFVKIGSSPSLFSEVLNVMLDVLFHVMESHNIDAGVFPILVIRFLVDKFS